MAGTVFFSVSMSLDGFIAPGSSEDLMGQQWMELQQWIFPQRFLMENLKLGEGGEEGRDNDIVRETFEPHGAATRIEMRTVFPTKELRAQAVERYHAIEGGQQTLNNLAAYVTEIARKEAEG